MSFLAKEAFDAISKGFATRKSYPYEYRVQQLSGLRRMLVEHADAFVSAKGKDYGGGTTPYVETFMGEVAATLQEVDFALNNLKSWMEPEPVTNSPPSSKPSRTVLTRQPKGVALIISPWNFPTHLLLTPLIAAVSAGCAAVLKPSEVTANVSALIAKLVPAYLDPELYRVVEGGVSETTALLELPFNHFFYTGNGQVGRIVYAAAARHLASCTLELGGKSPCYVHADANVEVAAKRIVQNKLMNGGAVCVSPDYLMAHESIHDELVRKMTEFIEKTYGPDLGRQTVTHVVNPRHFQRVKSLVESPHGGRILTGGSDKAQESDSFYPLTLISNPKLDSHLMREEIFGPVLPILPVRSLEDALEIINSRDASLASYVFTQSQEIVDRFVQRTQSGGTAVNDCIAHISDPASPFGGAGASGIGSYHGVYGFREFSVTRPVFHRDANPVKNESFGLLPPQAAPMLKKMILGAKPPKEAKL